MRTFARPGCGSAAATGDLCVDWHRGPRLPVGESGWFVDGSSTDRQTDFPCGDAVFPGYPDIPRPYGEYGFLFRSSQLRTWRDVSLGAGGTPPIAWYDPAGLGEDWMARVGAGSHDKLKMTEGSG